MTVAEVVRYGIKGDTNIYEFDVTGSLDVSNDIILFTAKSNSWDADADALFQKALNHGTIADTGIVITDGPNGLFRVTLGPDDTDDLDVFAFFFDCQVYDNSQSETVTIAKGVILLTDEATETAAV